MTLQDIEEELLRIADDVDWDSRTEESLRDLARRIAVASLNQGAAA